MLPKNTPKPIIDFGVLAIVCTICRKANDNIQKVVGYSNQNPPGIIPAVKESIEDPSIAYL